MNTTKKLLEQKAEEQARLGISFKYLNRDMGEELLAVNRKCPIVSDISLYFERSPDFFRWPELVYDFYHYIGAFLDDKLIAYSMGGAVFANVLDGPGHFFYGGDVRVLEAYRGLRLSVAGARKMFEEVVPDDIQIGASLVKKDNTSTQKILDTQQWGAFATKILCGYETVNMLLMRDIQKNLTMDVQHARIEDIEEIALLLEDCYRGRLLAPRLSPEKIAKDAEDIPSLGMERYYVARKNGKIVGVMAAWDHSAFKRTVIEKLSLSGKLTRLAYQAGRLFFHNAAPLPRVGEAFRAISLTRVAIKDRDPSILYALLQQVIHEHIGKGYHMLHLGLREGDPLLKATKGLFAQRLKAQISLYYRKNQGLERYLEQPQDPYLDIVLI